MQQRFLPAFRSLMLASSVVALLVALLLTSAKVEATSCTANSNYLLGSLKERFPNENDEMRYKELRRVYLTIHECRRTEKDNFTHYKDLLTETVTLETLHELAGRAGEERAQDQYIDLYLNDVFELIRDRKTPPDVLKALRDTLSGPYYATRKGR